MSAATKRVRATRLPMSSIKERHQGHWFSEGTMQFFKTRLHGSVWQGPGGIYFVTSEQGPSMPRRYSVRRYDPIADNINTVGAFNSYSDAEEAADKARALAEGLVAE